METRWSVSGLIVSHQDGQNLAVALRQQDLRGPGSPGSASTPNRWVWPPTVSFLSFCWFRLCVAVSQSAFLVSTTQWCDFLIIVDIIHWETLTQEKLISSIFCSLYNLITRVSLVTKTDFYHIRRPWNPDGELCMRSLRIIVVSSSIFFFSLSTKITN